MENQRLPSLVERRQVGVSRNPLTGRLEPVIRSYLIGHGQQLARARLAALAGGNGPAIERPPSRQVLRRSQIIAAKKARRH